MMVLIVGLILFLGIHLLPTSPELRDRIAGANRERTSTKPSSRCCRSRASSSSCLATTSCSFTREKPDPVEPAGVDTAHRGRADAAGNDLARCVADTVENPNDYSSPDAVRDQDLGARASHRERRSRRCFCCSGRFSRLPSTTASPSRDVVRSARSGMPSRRASSTT